MGITIKERNENPIIGRLEVRFELNYEQAPPNRQQVRDAIAKELGANAGLVVVRKMHDVFGMRKAVGTAHVYRDEGTFKKYVSKYVLVRMGLMTKEQAKPPKAVAAKAPVKKKL